MDPSQFTLPQMQPLDPDEQAALHIELTARNEERALRRQRAANRAAGIGEPRPGDRLYVSPARGIKARGRAGVRFTEDARAKLVVVDPEMPRVDAPAGFVAITPDQAEAILGDSSLVTHASSQAETDINGERARADRAEQALEAARRENDTLREAVARARREARDPGDGTSGRLKAAARARAEAKAKPESGDRTEEFGSEG